VADLITDIVLERFSISAAAARLWAKPQYGLKFNKVMKTLRLIFKTLAGVVATRTDGCGSAPDQQ
jgi:biotin transporter BioY